MNNRSTADVAALYHVTPRRIRAIAKSRVVEPVEIVPGRFVWDREAIRRLRPGKPGRRPRSQHE